MGPGADCLARGKVLPRQTVLPARGRESLGSAGQAWCLGWSDESGEATLPLGFPSPSYTRMKTVPCPHSGNLNTTQAMWKESSRETEWHILLPPFLLNPPGQTNLALSSPSSVSSLFILNS